MASHGLQKPSCEVEIQDGNGTNSWVRFIRNLDVARPTASRLVKRWGLALNTIGMCNWVAKPKGLNRMGLGSGAGGGTTEN
jgi:hypothetical protein